MVSSLIPERHIVISPTLAATIGLEEAVLLQENNLSDLLDYDPKNHGPSRWEFLEQAMTHYCKEMAVKEA